jgi:mRNA interferase MazF
MNDGHHKHLRLAIVVPITGSNAYLEKNPFFVGLEPNPTNGIRKKSLVDCFQIRAIGHKKFMERIGFVSANEMDLIKKSLALILDIDPKHCD